MSGAWLHNMSVPPRSTVNVRRQPLPGRRYALDCGLLTTKAVAELRAEGEEAALRLVQSAAQPRRLFDTMLGRTLDPGAPLDAHFERALDDARIPGRLGVFIETDDEDHEIDMTADVRLGPIATLAVLARRSGPLYLPQRPFSPSLIAPAAGLLVFPE